MPKVIAVCLQLTVEFFVIPPILEERTSTGVGLVIRTENAKNLLLQITSQAQGRIDICE
jgi:hypothetical protein